eukprot:TRINITY_DN10143_c0_g1_i1.p1 TRINITY_DN10143_c0_g1~~TRINITY_DN10143_c0_g1_i1.p1  ORF type:complete len:483 (+),score=141.68 TRINITY_DN10143_c0_g1_i1:60-1451(+)
MHGAALLTCTGVWGAFGVPGWAALPDAAQNAAMPGHASRESAAGVGGPPLLPSGLKPWGADCDDGGECGSGLCCSSCSADVGSCMCPCENNPAGNGPWNGEWPVRLCCCATVSFTDTCAVDADARVTLQRGGHCNPGVGVQDIAAAEAVERRSPSPPAPTPAPQWVAGPVRYTLEPGAEAAMQEDAAAALLPFGAVCSRWSECGSGICATGCDCDNARLAVPQPCSCNCVTPSARSRSNRQEWGSKTCGAFFVGDRPCRQACPPCDDATCSAIRGQHVVDAGREYSARCRYMCTAGRLTGSCSLYPSYWLGAASAGCDRCCNANFCPIVPPAGANRTAVAADAAAVFADTQRLCEGAERRLTRGELREALYGQSASAGSAQRWRRLMRVPAAADRLLESEDVLEGLFQALDEDSNEYVTEGEAVRAALARWGYLRGHPAGLVGGWSGGTDKGGEDVWTADLPE